jgi:uncharacterized membrane-anchored protein YitT (DUF2179 family)
MNPIFQQIVINATLGGKKTRQDQKEQSRYGLAKAFLRFKVLVKREVLNSFLLAAGVFVAGFGLKGFLLPSGFIDGGITGISLLISKISGVALAILIPLLNIPFIFLGYRIVGRVFALKTILAIIGLSLAVAFINYPVLSTDKLIVAVFGGFLLGAGIGLAIRGGGVMDGTEVMAIYIGKKSTLTIGDVILILNIIIFSFAAWLLSFEVAFYSILTYLAASKTVDFVLNGIEEYTGVTIISQKSEEIRKVIIEGLGRGVTIYKGSKGYGKRGHNLDNIDIIYTVVTRLEVSKLNIEIEKIDPQAFVVMNSLKDIKGGMIKKRPLS